MTSLLESLTQSLQPDIVSQLGKAAGLDSLSTTKGLEVVGPLLTGALADTSSSSLGLDRLIGMVSQVSSASTPDDLANDGLWRRGAPMLSGLSGPRLNGVTGTLDLG